MTPYWIFVIASLIIQEPASIGAAILIVREHGLDIPLVNFIWLVATAFGTAVGYGVGEIIQRTKPNSRFVRWGKEHAYYLEERIGSKGTHVAALLLGFVNVPYINGFLFSWMNMSFLRSFVLIVVGNGLYWAFAWVLAVGVRQVIDDWRVALLVVLALGLLASAGFHAVFKRIRKG